MGNERWQTKFQVTHDERCVVWDGTYIRVHTEPAEDVPLDEWYVAGYLADEGHDIVSERQLLVPTHLARLHNENLDRAVIRELWRTPQARDGHRVPIYFLDRQIVTYTGIVVGLRDPLSSKPHYGRLFRTSPLEPPNPDEMASGPQGRIIRGTYPAREDYPKKDGVIGMYVRVE